MAAEMRANRKSAPKESDLEFLLNLREEKVEVGSEEEWLVSSNRTCSHLWSLEHSIE